MGKNAPRNIFEILFWPETSKNDHSRGGSKVARALVLKSMSPFTSQKCLFIPRIALLFPELLFYFPALVFYFPEMPFCFLELSSFYLLCGSFSKNAFFPSKLYLLVKLRAAQRDNICHALVLFSLGTIYWPTDALHLKTLCLKQKSIFCLLYFGMGN